MLPDPKRFSGLFPTQKAEQPFWAASPKKGPKSPKALPIKENMCMKNLAQAAKLISLSRAQGSLASVGHEAHKAPKTRSQKNLQSSSQPANLTVQKDFGLRRPGTQPLTLYRGPKKFTDTRKLAHQYDAQIRLQVTQNNTIGSITTLTRGCLYTTSSGAQGFRGARRGTSAAFFAVGVALSERAQNLGIYRVQVHTQGMSKFRVNLLRGLLWGGLTIVSLHEASLRPHNGCRPPAIRRL